MSKKFQATWELFFTRKWGEDKSSPYSLEKNW